MRYLRAQATNPDDGSKLPLGSLAIRAAPKQSHDRSFLR
jgi:hypothetical protein